MTAVATALDSLTLDLTQETHVRSSVTATFAALLEEIGPGSVGQNHAPMPTLLEITGPLMMSFAVASNVQYRLKEVDGGTTITLHHTAIGLFPDGYREALTHGFSGVLVRIRKRLEQA